MPELHSYYIWSLLKLTILSCLTLCCGILSVSSLVNGVSIQPHLEQTHSRYSGDSHRCPLDLDAVDSGINVGNDDHGDFEA